MNRFNWITSVESECARPAHDRPVAQTEHFVALPTLGALVPGWLLVVPRRQMENLSFLNELEQRELRSFSKKLADMVRGKKSDIYLFEHGGHVGSKVSCGVDQAHLHIVPLGFDLVAKATQAGDVEWATLRDGQNTWGSNDPMEYLSVSLEGDAWHVGRPKTPTSQWFRRLIATELGISERWNFREYPELHAIDSTLALIERTNG